MEVLSSHATDLHNIFYTNSYALCPVRCSLVNNVHFTWKLDKGRLIYCLYDLPTATNGLSSCKQIWVYSRRNRCWILLLIFCMKVVPTMTEALVMPKGAHPIWHDQSTGACHLTQWYWYQHSTKSGRPRPTAIFRQSPGRQSGTSSQYEKYLALGEGGWEERGVTHKYGGEGWWTSL